MLLTPHFSLGELTATHQVDHGGRLLFNQPNELEMVYLQLLCERVLEPIRGLIGCPVVITSGYRGEAVERSVQERAHLIQPGAPLSPSQHRRGQAADFAPEDPNVSVYAAYARIVESAIPFDQLLLEGMPGHEWIHVSTAPVLREPRRQALVSADGLHFTPYQPPAAGPAAHEEKPA